MVDVEAADSEAAESNSDDKIGDGGDWTLGVGDKEKEHSLQAEATTVHHFSHIGCTHVVVAQEVGDLTSEWNDD